jgi:opacity protein-like surface antigen
MFKKTMLLALSAGAIIAFAAPAMAQADELVESGGTVHLAKGAEVTATSTNLATVVPGVGTLTCSKVTVHGTLKKVTAPITIGQTTTEVEGCNVPVTNPEVAEIVIEGGSGEGSGVSFTADLSPSCMLGGTVAFTYTTNSDVLSIAGSILTGTCGGGQGTISGSFTLETANGTAIEVS